MSHHLRRAPIAAIVTAVSCCALAGCGSSGPAPEKGSLDISPTARPSAPTLPQVAPVAGGDCPYLDVATVERLNGERVRYVRLDDRQNPPACFFYSQDERVQLSTQVASASSGAAAARMVDDSVPVAGGERADLPGGWTGGKAGGGQGSVLAVARDRTVLVVRSGQEQSIKVQRIGEEVARRL